MNDQQAQQNFQTAHLKIIENARSQAEHLLYNVGAEISFLACLVKRPEWITTAAERVPPDWLHHGFTRAVYTAMLGHAWTAMQNHRPWVFDAESLYQFEVSQGRGEQFIAQTTKLEAMRTVQGRAESPYFDPDKVVRETVDYLRQTALRVSVFRQGTRLQEQVTNPAADPMQIVALAQNDLAKLSGGGNGQGITSVGDGELSVNRTPGIRATHLPKLADVTGGFGAGTLSIICARTNVGKSVFLGSLALDAAVNQKIPVLYLDTEMGANAMLQRAVAWHTGIDENAMFKNGGYESDPAIHQKADEAKAIIKAAPLFVAPIGTSSPEQVIGLMRQFRRCMVDGSPARLGLIVFDYFKAAGSGKIPEWQLLGDLAAGVRNVAVELDLPIVAGMQAGRQALKFGQNDYAEQGIGIAAGSDRPSHHADLFCILRNVSEAETQRVQERFGTVDADHPRNRLRFNQLLHVVKQRSGPTLEQGIPLAYAYGTARYAELAYERGSEGQPVTDARGRKIDSDEIKFVHSREFQRKTAKGKVPEGSPIKLAS